MKRNLRVGIGRFKLKVIADYKSLSHLRLRIQTMQQGKFKDWALTVGCLFDLTRVQRLEATTSLILGTISSMHPCGLHNPLWDLEIVKPCLNPLQLIKQALREVQIEYDLPNIWVNSDAEASYRAWCYAQVPFKTYLKILLDTEYVDPQFFFYTVKRRAATLRTSKKIDREKEKVVLFLPSYTVPFPKEREKVTYDTGIVKKGVRIELGNKKTRN